MESQIILGQTVIVSDPCYENGTWCQSKVTGVIPGRYNCSIEREDDGHIRSLTVLHEDVTSPHWEEHSNIAVDSGQAGVFSEESYRNNESTDHLPWLTKDGDPFGGSYQEKDEPGEKWYVKMCDRTLRKEGWGVYDNGVVSSSGYGDGGYLLEVTDLEGYINGFKITFIFEDEYEDEESGTFEFEL